MEDDKKFHQIGDVRMPKDNSNELKHFGVLSMKDETGEPLKPFRMSAPRAIGESELENNAANQVFQPLARQKPSSSVWTRIWRELLVDTSMTPERFALLKQRYFSELFKTITEPSFQTAMDEALSAEFASGAISWETFLKALHFLGAEKVLLSVILINSEGAAIGENVCKFDLEKPSIETPTPVSPEDIGLTAEQLDDKYNPDGDGEHPVYTKAKWRAAVSLEFTIFGYWAWAEDKINALELPFNR